ncbi:MAG TPA: DUF6580 family putative transport protein [Chitinophagaceae bacterium]|nr:DUF6580 family putative transport protein [Chitinophagaceae bacterium]
MKAKSRIILFTLLLVAITTIFKLLFAAKLEWSGFSPIIAIALFSGMIIKDKSKSFIFTLMALLISDVLIEVFYRMGLFPFEGLYKYQWLNYSFLLLTTLIGWVLQGKNYSRIFAGAVAGPTLFFLISNSLVWAGHGGWGRPMNFEGFILCMQDGLPFYKNSLIATLLFMPVLIGSYNYLVKKTLSLKLA